MNTSPIRHVVVPPGESLYTKTHNTHNKQTRTHQHVCTTHKNLGYTFCLKFMSCIWSDPRERRAHLRRTAFILDAIQRYGIIYSATSRKTAPNQYFKGILHTFQPNLYLQHLYYSMCDCCELGLCDLNFSLLTIRRLKKNHDRCFNRTQPID